MSSSHQGAGASKSTQSVDQTDVPVRIPIPPRLLLPIPSSDGLLPPGMRVRRGQRLFASDLGLNRMPLAPVDGTLGKVVEVELIDGAPSAAVEIETLAHSTFDAPDASEGASTEMPPPRDFAAFIEHLRRLGLSANRQTCPNLLAQLRLAARRPIDTILCSLLDLPGGRSMLNAAAMSATGDALLAGIKGLSSASGARVWLVAETELARRAAASFRKDDAAKSIRIIELDNAYPQADPTLLIFALLGRRLRPDKLPPDVACILIDAPAAVAIGQCMSSAADVSETPPGHLETFIQLRDSRRGESRTFIVLLGTPLRCLLDAAAIVGIDRAVLRAGAALSDIRIGSIDAVIDGHELIIDIGPAPAVINPEPCIRCGWCVEACPVRIHPARLLEAAQENDTAAATRFGVGACIECGICSYLCPSRLPLLAGIRRLRKTVAGSITSEPAPA